jgi:hypothetical protein|tara:strand:- start:107 stop:448 length:342 start_codon:yes stop_codon:yes gene_type:complete
VPTFAHTYQGDLSTVGQIEMNIVMDWISQLRLVMVVVAEFNFVRWTAEAQGKYSPQGAARSDKCTSTCFKRKLLNSPALIFRQDIFTLEIGISQADSPNINEFISWYNDTACR